jgi:uncharacterized protein
MSDADDDGPLPARQRLPTLDIVRGFALLGMLVMNMPGYSGSFFAEADGSHLWGAPLDRVATTLRNMLFSGKFNSLFSLLFGIGFTLQYARMVRAAPREAERRYLRRLLLLLVLGLLHGAVFWTGDVLHVYAVLGLALVLGLHRAGDRVLWGLIALCLLFPVASGVAELLFVGPDEVRQIVALQQAWERSNNIAYGNGGFLDAAREHAREFRFFYSNGWALWYMAGFWTQMATTLLLGVLAGRHRLVQRLPVLMPRLRRLQWCALGLGLACALVFGLIGELNRAPGPSPLKLLATVAYVLSRVALACFYVLVIARLAQRPEWQRRLAPIAAAGRLPLTNYLAQTMICTALFYGWGLGLWGRVSPAAGLALAFAIFFLVQVPASMVWLRHFDVGPLEVLGRLVTYGRRAGRRLRAA